MVAGNIWHLYSHSPAGFPEQDTGNHHGRPQGRSELFISGHCRQTGKPDQYDSFRDPAVARISAHISGARAEGRRIHCLETHMSERAALGPRVLLTGCAGKLSAMPGLTIFSQPRPGHPHGRTILRIPVTNTPLQADNLDALREWGRKLQQALVSEPQFQDVDSDIEERGLQTMLTVNRDALVRLGLDPRPMWIQPSTMF